MKKIILGATIMLSSLACKTDTNDAVKAMEKPTEITKTTKELKEELISKGF